MRWLLFMLAACSTEFLVVALRIVQQQHLRTTSACRVRVLALRTHSSERLTTMAAFPAGARDNTSQHISGNKDKTRQMELAAKVKEVGRSGKWRDVLALLDKAAFTPNSFVWRAAIEAMGGQWQEAMDLLDRMVFVCSLNTSTIMLP
jgi:hypothetical protein